MVDTPKPVPSQSLDIRPQLNSKENELNAASPRIELTEEAVQKLIEEKVASVKAEILNYTKSEIQATNTSFMTVFGLFAAITSFLTIEFQILKTLSNIMEIVGFTLILWSLFFSFNLGLDYLATSRENRGKYQPSWYLQVVAFAPLIVGMLLICCDKR